LFALLAWALRFSKLLCRFFQNSASPQGMDRSFSNKIHANVLATELLKYHLLGHGQTIGDLLSHIKETATPW